MCRTLLLFLLFQLAFNFLNAQNFTAKIIDRNTQNPIPFAAIQFDEKSGSISNEEGFFTIDLENKSAVNLTISCLGYSNITIATQKISQNNFVIRLDEAINQLDEVYLSNRTPNPDSIIAHVNRNIKDNYQIPLVKHSIFSRETTYATFKDVDFDLDKATHVNKTQMERANKSLDSLEHYITNNKSIHFADFQGDLFVKSKDSVKLKVNKATRLIDQNTDFSIKKIQSKTQNLVLKYLDSSKTYKLKSGLFKIEDSMSLSSAKNKSEKHQQNEYTISGLKEKTHERWGNSQFYSDAVMNSIIDTNLYKYEFLDVTYQNNELVYIINYKPRKAKAKYTGKIYVSSDNYAIIKMDYTFAKGKHGEKLNLRLLIGVKYVEDLRNGVMIFKKNEHNKYQPQYIKHTYGSYFYAHRPIKFIENSPNKNKVAFDLKLEGNIINKQEILFTDNSEINNDEFQSLKETKNVPFQLLKKYDSGIWDSSKTLEPLEEMKQFESSEKF